MKYLVTAKATAWASVVNSVSPKEFIAGTKNDAENKYRRFLGNCKCGYFNFSAVLVTNSEPTEEPKTDQKPYSIIHNLSKLASYLLKNSVATTWKEAQHDAGLLARDIDVIEFLKASTDTLECRAATIINQDSLHLKFWDWSKCGLRQCFNENLINVYQI